MFGIIYKNGEKNWFNLIALNSQKQTYTTQINQFSMIVHDWKPTYLTENFVSSSKVILKE